MYNMQTHQHTQQKGEPRRVGSKSTPDEKETNRKPCCMQTDLERPIVSFGERLAPLPTVHHCSLP